jgi:5-(hydroxymethyl)furfural/furfural oxidase
LEKPNVSTSYDYIIVGGGSAGAVLANRLSLQSRNQVLLCEAGEDTMVGRVPEAILDSRSAGASRDPRFLWHRLRITTEAMADERLGGPPPRPVRYEQARVMGGGSSINGQLANRGVPADYDEWEARGAAGWCWEKVLPYFRKLEWDTDFDGPLHGSDGPIPVRRVFPGHWSEQTKAVAGALSLSGHRYLADQNGDFADGYYPLAISNLYDRRVSAAIGYLGPVVRQRSNLSIPANTQVSELLFEGTRCIGVRAIVAQQEIEFHAREVILCCGAIHSPAMLLRAGIGPAAALQDLDIPVRAHVPGVGQGLMDHPSISIASFLHRRARGNPYNRHSHLMGMRFSSGLADAPQGDMALVATTAFRERIAVVTVWVNKTYTHAGQVRLASADWQEEPRVDFNLLADHRDLVRLADGFRRVAALHDLPPMQTAMSDPFPASFTDKVRAFGDIDRGNKLRMLKNKVVTHLGALLLDGPAPLRRFMMDRFILETEGLDSLLQDSEQLEAYLRKATVGVWHCSCSCRMGAESDPMAVTSATGQVRGVQALRVVDASIFPTIPCANTNFPTMMVAEKIAEAILDRAAEIPEHLSEPLGQIGSA